VQAVLQRTGTPGATLLVLRDGRLLYEKAYGLRSISPRLPAGLGTHYEIGSITKQFTAAAVLQLQAAGKLSLDATVATYLPEAPHASEITLRQLLTHTSGLPDFLAAMSDEQATRPATFPQLMEYVKGKPLDSPPGSKASYSNTGYILLGRLIELASHDSYRDYIQTHLLTPSGMTQTHTVSDEASLQTMAKGYRHANGKLEPGLIIHETIGWSAGDLVSTVQDLQKWNAALMGGVIVSPADYASMCTPYKDTGMGLGLFIETAYGQPRIGHTGGSYGFTTANFYFPAQKLRVIALTNNADQPEAGEIITNVVFEEVFPELARATMQPASDEDPMITVKAKACFAQLQSGADGAALFSASLAGKMKAGLAKRFAETYAPYGAPTAFIFKGRRTDAGKQWYDYLIATGPGSTVKLSIALDAEGKILSLGFNNF
jgi:D-alanyl-D-alanine carboxypeptidase